MRQGDIRGWLAGYFDGEGSIVIYRGRLGNGHTVMLKVDSTDYDCLQRFQDAYGGTVLPRTVRACNPKSQWRWSICAANVVYNTLEEWYPLLSSRRKAKAEEAFLCLHGNKNLTVR